LVLQIAVTGANGFVGRMLIRKLLAHGHNVRALMRFPDAALANEPIEAIATGPIEAIDDWRPYLTGIDTVIHLAARSHLDEQRMQDAALFRAVNTTATLSLAKSAMKRKVSHFIYLSSVGVHGDETYAGAPFCETSPYNPQNHYARSKAEAEQGLRALHEEGGMGITVLRPPLIYGAGARGNFRKLCELVRRAPALPFGLIDNRRSMIAVENLSSTVCTVAARGGSGLAFYMSADSRDFSLPELVRGGLLMQAARLAGRGAQMHTLTHSLQADASAFRRAFPGKDEIEPETALRQAAAWLTDALKTGLNTTPSS
jgi:UDP-glucose 4-epimerase